MLVKIQVLSEYWILSGPDTSIIVLWFFVWNIDELSIRQNIVAKKLSKADKNCITNI